MPRVRDESLLLLIALDYWLYGKIGKKYYEEEYKDYSHSADDQTGNEE